MKPATFYQFVLCLGFFLAATPRMAAQDFVPDSSSWRTQKDMNRARAYFPAVNVGRKIYAFGGITANNGGVFTYTNSIEEYNIISDEWIEKDTLPQPMAAMAAVELNGAIYIIGGVTEPTAATSSSKVYRYLLASGTFDADTIAPLPAARSYLSACAVNNKIYAIGGATGFFGAVSNTVYEYDPLKNTWSTGPALKTGRATHTCAVVGGKIYVMGGTVSWLNSINSVEVLDTYSPVPSWETSGKPLSHARANHGSAVLWDMKYGDVIYALGGIQSVSAAEMSVEAYRPEVGDTWEVFTNLTYDRRAFGCVSLPNDDFGLWPRYIYIMGGLSGNTLLSSTQRLEIFTVVGVEETVPNALENANASLSNFPNPFGQHTTISYTLGESMDIEIAILDARGRLMSVPVSGLQTPGEHRVLFDGARLENGVYFCIMHRSDGADIVRKMIVLR